MLRFEKIFLFFIDLCEKSWDETTSELWWNSNPTDLGLLINFKKRSFWVPCPRETLATICLIFVFCPKFRSTNVKHWKSAWAKSFRRHNWMIPTNIGQSRRTVAEIYAFLKVHFSCLWLFKVTIEWRSIIWSY